MTYIGPVGIANAHPSGNPGKGNACCINSVFQCFEATETLSEFAYSLTDEKIQSLFQKLRDSKNKGKVCDFKGEHQKVLFPIKEETYRQHDVFDVISRVFSLGSTSHETPFQKDKKFAVIWEGSQDKILGKGRVSMEPILTYALSKKEKSFFTWLENQYANCPESQWYYEGKEYYGSIFQKTNEQARFAFAPSFFIIKVAREEKSGSILRWPLPPLENKEVNFPALFFQDGQSYSYRLTSYITHHGEKINSGHYTASVDQGGYYRIDDERLQLLNDEAFLKGARAASALFFEKKSVSSEKQGLPQDPLGQALVVSKDEFDDCGVPTEELSIAPGNNGWVWVDKSKD